MCRVYKCYAAIGLFLFVADLKPVDGGAGGVHKSVEGGAGGVHKCGFCSWTFSHPLSLQAHLKVHTDTGAGQYSCDTCGQYLTDGIYTHAHTHTDTHTHTHAHTQTQTHARTHTRDITHTHTDTHRHGRR
jgi:hypothetical protein